MDTRETNTDVRRLEDKIAALEALTEARFVTLRTVIDSQADKVAIALAASDKAIIKAEAAQEKRNEAQNEFRAQLTDQAATFMRRDLYDGKHEDLIRQLDQLNARVNTSEGQKQGGVDARAIMIAVAGILIAVIGLASRFIK